MRNKIKWNIFDSVPSAARRFLAAAERKSASSLKDCPGRKTLSKSWWMRQFWVIFEMQLYILYFEIIDFDVKQSWTELCWIPPRLVTTWRRHKSELSTSVSYTGAHVSANRTSVARRWENWQDWSPETHQLSSAYTQATDLPHQSRTELRDWTRSALFSYNWPHLSSV